VAVLSFLIGYWALLGFASSWAHSAGVYDNRASMMVFALVFCSAPMAWFVASAIDAVRAVRPRVMFYLQMGALSAALMAPLLYVGFVQGHELWILIGPPISGALANLTSRAVQTFLSRRRRGEV
jgi:hypothetical protein